MRFKKIVTILTCSSILFSSFLCSGVSANAFERESISKNNFKTQENNQEYAKLIQKLDNEGIDKNTQKALIEKLKDGELWDSLKPESVPVAEEKCISSDGSMYIKRIFEDGSIIKVLDYSTNARATPNINYGETISSSLYHTEYKGGRVGIDLIIADFGMRVDWTWNRYNKSVIKRVYSPWATSIGADIDITVQPNTSNKTMQVKIKIPFAGSAHHNLTVYLKNNATLDGRHQTLG